MPDCQGGLLPCRRAGARDTEFEPVVAIGRIGQAGNQSRALDTLWTLYALVSIADLMMSVTASTGMQARHRMPPLQFWSMIIGLSAGSRGIFISP
jgi:hypothetical protein